MAPDRVEKTAYFQGKSLEFVADWLEKNNLSNLNLYSRHVYYKLLNEGAFDANGMTFITNIEIFLQRICMKQMHGFILNRDLSPVFL